MSSLIEMAKEVVARAEKATPQNLGTAELHVADGWYECPACGGEGSVDGETYTNYDGVANGVQFFGIGDEFGLAEKLFRTGVHAAPAIAAALLRAEELLADHISTFDGFSDYEAKRRCDPATYARYQATRAFLASLKEPQQ